MMTQNEFFKKPLVLFILALFLGYLGVQGIITGKAILLHGGGYSSKAKEPFMYWLGELIFLGGALSLFFKAAKGMISGQTNTSDAQSTLQEINFKASQVASMYPDMQSKIEELKEKVRSLEQDLISMSFLNLLNLMISEPNPDKARKTLDTFDKLLKDQSK